jgi:hypothetical protein
MNTCVTTQIVLCTILSSIAAGGEVVMPPLTEKTIVGVWEAIPMQPRPTEILHMEINKDNGSYLVSIFNGSPSHTLFRLVSSEINKLHFQNAISNEQPKELWFEGRGEGGELEGTMQGKLWTNFPPPPKTDNVFFVKGVWTRGIAEASNRAEEVIKAQK